MAVFDRGDVVSVPLDPAIGHEQKGTRPALVLTTKEFNKLGDVLVAPITVASPLPGASVFASIDNLYLAVPSPGAAALVGLAGLLAKRRRT